MVASSGFYPEMGHLISYSLEPLELETQRYIVNGLGPLVVLAKRRFNIYLCNLHVRGFFVYYTLEQVLHFSLSFCTLVFMGVDTIREQKCFWEEAVQVFHSCLIRFSVIVIGGS